MIVQKDDFKVPVNGKIGTSTDTPSAECAKRGLQAINPAQIVVRAGRELDYSLVLQIRESLSLTGGVPIQPIMARWVIDPATKNELAELVCGAHRLAAVIEAGLDSIDCMFVEADDDQAVLLQRGEDLFRKHLSVLRKAEALTEFVKAASVKAIFLGQVDQKKIGRPEGGTAQLSRILEWPVLGQNPDARRQAINRARKIAAIVPEAKSVAVESGLDNLQNALLAIANEKGAEDQITKAKELTKAVAPLASAPSTSVAAKKRLDEQLSDGDESRHRMFARSQSSNVTKTSIDDLRKRWRKDCRKLWRHAPPDVRKAFLGDLETVKYRAPFDELIENIERLFRGRKRAETKPVRKYLREKGFTNADVKKVLHQRGYRIKTIGRGRAQEKYYENRDPLWDTWQKAVSDLELAKYAEKAVVGFSGPRPGDDDYYEI